MDERTTVEAEGALGPLLDRVERGEEIVITRDGKRVARLVPDCGGHDREEARRAAQTIIARSKGVTLGGLKIQDLINEGRP